MRTRHPTIIDARRDSAIRGQAHLCAIGLMLTCALPVLAADEQANTSEPPYNVRDGKVDQSTYLGWRAFHSTCHARHGVDALGTSVAPNLVEQILRRERGELIMPAWEADTSIRPHVLDLYAYLRARADGALQSGKPELL